MADKTQRTPKNVPGKFYVDNRCLDHAMCQHLAPRNFAYDEERACYYVCKQPETPEELAQCLEAVACCPMVAIGKDGEDVLGEKNKPMSGVPDQALDLNYNNTGFLPNIGLYQHGTMFLHGPSRSHFGLLGILLIAALVVASLPWHTRAMVGELKYWIAGMLLFGGLCDIIATFLQSRFRQQVAIDPKNRTVAIAGRDLNCQLAWEQIIGLQICQQKVAGNSRMNGYQLILVWREADGVVRRHCLFKHAVKGFVVRLARRYQSLFGFTVMDYTHAS